jgi:hypothetical protein
MVSKVLPFLRDCMTGVNGQSLKTLPTPFAELILDVANGKERSGVSGKDLEALGLASPPKTVDSQSLQREIFRSGPFYAQWFERWQNGEHLELLKTERPMLNVLKGFYNPNVWKWTMRN